MRWPTPTRFERACIAIKAVAGETAKFVHAENFMRLTQHAAAQGLSVSWLRTWISQPAFAFGGKVPMAVLGEPGGLQSLKDVVGRIAYGVHT